MPTGDPAVTVAVRETTESGEARVSSWELQPGEKVIAVGRPALAAVWFRYIMTLGYYAFWHRRRVAVLTNKRIMLGRGLFSRQERSIPLRQISEAMYTRKGLAGYCHIRVQNDLSHRYTTIGPLPSRTAHRFATEMQARMPA